MNYERIFWKDGTDSKTTPINANNLNKMDYAIDQLSREAKERDDTIVQVRRSISDNTGYIENVKTTAEQTKTDLEELKQTTDQHISGMQQLILIKEYEVDNVEIPANEIINVTVPETSRTGYTRAIGHVSVANASDNGGGSSLCTCNFLNIASGKNSVIGIRNNRTTASRIRIAMRLIYVRNDSTSEA